MNDDLISRDELYENMLYAMCGTGYQSVALREIELMPSVDAVPVIRCRVCLKKRLCSLYRETHDENGFCAWGDKEE